LVLTRKIIIIATSKFLGNFLWTIFLKLFLHELIYEFNDSIDLKWCIIHRFTHSLIKKFVLTREIIIIATSNFLGNFLWTIFLKLFLHELIYEFHDSIDLIWCIRHRFTHSVIKKLVVTREIIIIATSNFLGNFLWTIFLKLFLHELIYEFIDSIDLIWSIRHRFTHSVIKNLVLPREIIIIATSNFLGNFIWTFFLKLFLHELIYEFHDSIDLIWCIRHRFTHSVIKNWF
jgi:Rps23 Pro-64 3,4-dihydroxylase Tpa1-like proline 4-hydroxylase